MMANLAIWLNSVGIQDHRGRDKCQNLANSDHFWPILPILSWMPTDFNRLAYFDITNVHMNEKYCKLGGQFHQGLFSILNSVYLFVQQRLGNLYFN